MVPQTLCEPPGDAMKFGCLGYFNEKSWEALSESERNALMYACFAHGDELRKGGHFDGGEALQSARSATTGEIPEWKAVRHRRIPILEARDLASARADAGPASRPGPGISQDGRGGH
jgi:hypothetical protein